MFRTNFRSLVHQIYHFVIVMFHMYLYTTSYQDWNSFSFFFLSFASFHIDGNTLLAIFFFLLVRTLIKYLAGIDTESFYDPNNCTREHRHGPLELISFRSHFVNRPVSPLFFSQFLSLFVFNIDTDRYMEV